MQNPNMEALECRCGGAVAIMESALLCSPMLCHSHCPALEAEAIISVIIESLHFTSPQLSRQSYS